MAEKKGYDDVEYNSGAEQRDRKRDSCIRGYHDTYAVEPSSESGKKPEGGFVERNNVRDRL